MLIKIIGSLSWITASIALYNILLYLQPFGYPHIYQGILAWFVIYYLGPQSLILVFLTTLIYFLTTQSQPVGHILLPGIIMASVQVCAVIISFAMLKLLLTSIKTFIKRLKFKQQLSHPRCLTVYQQILSHLSQRQNESHANQDTIEQFKKSGILYIKQLVTPSICRFISGYALQSYRQQPFFEGPDQQVPATHSVYADQVMEALLLFLLPKIENHTGLKLYPTFSYYRLYKPGDSLKLHHDRSSCEVTATLCLYHTDTTCEQPVTWPLHIISRQGQIQKHAIQVSDAVVYHGIELKHWRDAFVGQSLLQVFLHYVRQDTPHRIYKNDLRKDIGHPQLGALKYIIREYIGKLILAQKLVR